MRRSASHREYHISLATAVAVTYRDVMGEALAPTSTVEAWNGTLHAVAHALSNVCPLYSTSEEGKLFQISYFDLLEAKFDHGGAVLRVQDGTVYRRLTVSLEDLQSAVTILKRIGVRFDRRAA